MGRLGPAPIRVAGERPVQARGEVQVVELLGLPRVGAVDLVPQILEVAEQRVRLSDVDAELPPLEFRTRLLARESAGTIRAELVARQPRRVGVG